jgi:hypothetical protein
MSSGYEPSTELNSTPTISICYCLSSALFQWIEPTSISFLVYRFSSACIGLNRRLVECLSDFFNLRLSTVFLTFALLYCLANLSHVDHGYKTQ